MKEEKIVETEILDKISEISDISISFRKIRNGRFSVKMKCKGYSELFFSKNGYSTAIFDLIISKNEQEDIPIERYLISAIKVNGLFSICGVNKKTKKSECIFRIPEFESVSDLRIRIDMATKE